MNNLADEVDKKAPLSRLNLISPCKVISLGDLIKFSLSPSKSKDPLSTSVAGVPLHEKNLIHMDKKVSTGAGPGGGSGNAANDLWTANQFSDCMAAEKHLQRLFK